jgi:hypothetical protein
LFVVLKKLCLVEESTRTCLITNLKASSDGEWDILKKEDSESVCIKCDQVRGNGNKIVHVCVPLKTDSDNEWIQGECEKFWIFPLLIKTLKWKKCASIAIYIRKKYVLISMAQYMAILLN